MKYSIERIRGIDDITPELAAFFFKTADGVAEKYGNKFDPKSFDFIGYAEKGLFLVCRRDGFPVGALLARLYESIFDSEVIILYQDLLVCGPGSGRAAHLLYKHFIDFGRVHADHLFTCRAIHTNIKARSLEKLGFKKVEELWRMEF